MPIIIGAKIKIKTSLLAALPWWPFRSKWARCAWTLHAFVCADAAHWWYTKKEDPQNVLYMYIFLCNALPSSLYTPQSTAHGPHVCLCMRDRISRGPRRSRLVRRYVYVCGASVIGPRIKVTTLQVIRDALWTCIYACMHTFKAYGRRRSLRNTRERTNERTNDTNKCTVRWLSGSTARGEDDSVNWN